LFVGCETEDEFIQLSIKRINEYINKYKNTFNLFGGL